jgi:Ca2+-binding EF-hand superfamily protein
MALNRSFAGSIKPPAAYLDPRTATIVKTVPRAPPTGDPVIDKVRDKIVERSGIGGFRGLQRVLRIMDDNGNKMLERAEFKSGLETYGVFLADDELTAVIHFFDTDGSGQVDVTEFFRGIRGEMNDQRKALVIRCYDLLDQNTDGHVTFSDIKAAYDVNKHPEVLSGAKTPQQVLVEFMKGWDKNGDGLVTREEFIDYYNDISASIDNEDYFELMIRNAWHLHGGEGAAANTSNLRVLVLHHDGSQTIETVQNDLGIRRGDTEKIIYRLKQQGISDIKKISLI